MHERCALICGAAGWLYFVNSVMQILSDTDVHTHMTHDTLIALRSPPPNSAPLSRAPLSRHQPLAHTQITQYHNINSKRDSMSLSLLLDRIRRRVRRRARLPQAAQAPRHVARLHTRLPGRAVHLDPLLAARDQLARKHHDHVVPRADADAGVAAEGRVDRIVRETRAVDVVVRLDGHRANNVRGVNIKGAAALLLEMLVDQIADEDANVAIDRMAGRVELACRHMLLSGTLRDSDHPVEGRKERVVCVRQRAERERRG